MTRLKVGITGSRGFIGSHLIKAVNSVGHYIRPIYLQEINENYSNCCDGLNVFIHCAGISQSKYHIDNTLINRVNAEETLALAKQCLSNGVKRFIFISSIKVNGELTKENHPFTYKDTHNPSDFYGQSKSQAEKSLLQLAENTELEVVIIRPTLVYGPGVKANFGSLMNLVSKGYPLPFSCISTNKRSLLSVTNLVDLIITCIDHPKAKNQVFLVSDDNDISTASVVDEMSKALGKANRSIFVPLWCYHIIGNILNKQDVVKRLLGSLQVDITHTKETLNWAPPQTVEEGFKETAEAFLKNKSKNK